MIDQTSTDQPQALPILSNFCISFYFVDLLTNQDYFKMKLSTICTGLAYTLAGRFVQAFPTPADDATLSPYPDTYAERLNQVAQVFMSMSRNFKETTDNIPRECLTPNAQLRAGEREEAASCQLMKKVLLYMQIYHSNSI